MPNIHFGKGHAFAFRKGLFLVLGLLFVVLVAKDAIGAVLFVAVVAEAVIVVIVAVAITVAIALIVLGQGRLLLKL